MKIMGSSNCALRDYPDNYGLIREALVREIRDAERWATIEDAWGALLTIRSMANAMREERDLHFPNEEHSSASLEDCATARENLK